MLHCEWKPTRQPSRSSPSATVTTTIAVSMAATISSKELIAWRCRPNDPTGSRTSTRARQQHEHDDLDDHVERQQAGVGEDAAEVLGMELQLAADSQAAPIRADRPAERRVGKAGDRTFRTRRSPVS